MMSCEEFAEHASDYLEGRVPFGRQIGMWFHALICKRCGEYLDQIREVVEMLDEAGDREREQGAPDAVKRDLVDEFRSKHGS